jgi:hypothetical protein
MNPDPQLPQWIAINPPTDRIRALVDQAEALTTFGRAITAAITTCLELSYDARAWLSQINPDNTEDSEMPLDAIGNLTPMLHHVVFGRMETVHRLLRKEVDQLKGGSE